MFRIKSFSFTLASLLLFCFSSSAQISVEELGGAETNFEWEIFGEQVEVLSQGVFKRGYIRRSSDENQSYGYGAEVYHIELIVKNALYPLRPDVGLGSNNWHLIEYLDKEGEVITSHLIDREDLIFTRSENENYTIIGYDLLYRSMVQLTITTKVIIHDRPLNKAEQRAEAKKEKQNKK